MFGDSVLFGAGASQRQFGCGKILKTLIHVPVIIKGKNHDTSRDGLVRMKKDVSKYEDISHVLILFGNNDCRLVDFDKPVVNKQEYRANLKTMIDELKAMQKIPILSNLQPIDSILFAETLPEIARFMVEIKPYEGQKEYSDICGEIAGSEHILLADIRSRLESNGEKVISSDGIHPNDFGHKLIAEEFLEKIELSI